MPHDHPVNTRDQLVAELLAWQEALADQEAPSGPVVTIGVDDDRFELTPAQGRAFLWMLQGERTDREHRAEVAQLADEMAAAMLAGVEAGLDVGEMIGAAARAAAERLAPAYNVATVGADGQWEMKKPSTHEQAFCRGLGAARLVRGRPGSWEASLLVNWVKVGGNATGPAVQALTDVFIRVGRSYQPTDGGNLLSAALGKVADALGSVAAMADRSIWSEQLRNIGGQYAGTPDART